MTLPAGATNFQLYIIAEENVENVFFSELRDPNNRDMLAAIDADTRAALGDDFARSDIARFLSNRHGLNNVYDVRTANNNFGRMALFVPITTVDTNRSVEQTVIPGDWTFTISVVTRSGTTPATPMQILTIKNFNLPDTDRLLAQPIMYSNADASRVTQILPLTPNLASALDIRVELLPTVTLEQAFVDHDQGLRAALPAIDPHAMAWLIAGSTEDSPLGPGIGGLSPIAGNAFSVFPTLDNGTTNSIYTTYQPGSEPLLEGLVTTSLHESLHYAGLNHTVDFLDDVPEATCTNNGGTNIGTNTCGYDSDGLIDTTVSGADLDLNLMNTQSGSPCFLTNGGTLVPTSAANFTALCTNTTLNQPFYSELTAIQRQNLLNSMVYHSQPAQSR